MAIWWCGTIAKPLPSLWVTESGDWRKTSWVYRVHSYELHRPIASYVEKLQAQYRLGPSKIVTIEFWRDSEIAHPGAALTRRHYRLHPGTRFPVRAMGGDPDPSSLSSGVTYHA